jgi:hypothetical protein
MGEFKTISVFISDKENVRLYCMIYIKDGIKYKVDKITENNHISLEEFIEECKTTNYI